MPSAPVPLRPEKAELTLARSTPARKATRSLVWLGVILVALVLGNGAQVLWNGGSWTPKLALDLEGGTQIIMAAQLGDEQTLTQEQLDQAVSIIRQRVDASGVAEAEVTTQGDRNVVVAIPGEPDEATLQRIQSSAKLEFRPVLLTDVAPTSSVGEEDGATASPEPTPSPSLESTPTAEPTNASDLAWITPELQSRYDNFDCASLEDASAGVAPADEPLVTCEVTPQGSLKYLLGPVEVSGETISNATSGQVTNSQGAPTGEWGVFITFNDKGTKEFREVTERLVNLQGAQNQFAIVLDRYVISAPTTNSVIPDGKPQISGSFTQDSAKTLADQLKFGALPIGFEVQSQEAISATLGTSQLASGLLAGLIGLLLVVVYSLIQYRTLGTVTVASLVVAAVVTYFVVTYLSNAQGFRLSLAGVAGLIVAIGITADSFIVYFERVRDELRDGRALEGAVEAGWKRAIRTIVASDAVNFLAALVLYLLAVGNVRGFAFTLGVTTIVDLIVVALFTHPMLQLLGRTRFFTEGHRLSGLDPRALGAVYRGRAQFRTPAEASARNARAAREAERRQTIAERKAAAERTPETTRTGKES
ncbi:preprotein translocase subunit SecD [Diaminobutyricimonas aerilata]|uniref:Protein translocase subunit SecD n=1 Tax=Diaminobutyricimonas aerilata TaxID=1162967 RepID=A0A2M9CKB0_9MICO|nr:preprotein translocase subunit SecD [Diaminobutyricimonas aerilata]